ncbi:MAG: tRNA (cytidine(34)-2'-O)-methyltransferase [Alphaproteobacteria bacterium]|nr:tRNA (cytidine(34)-2'-O)-methyltransferase [Alphaproteobacteria bacterium]
MHIVLYQPDIPQNTGTILRLAACLNLTVDIIEPCGFVWDDAKLKRSGMDYLDQVNVKKHMSWDVYLKQRDTNRRLILLTTKSDVVYTKCDFSPFDDLVLGSESKGAPIDIHEKADLRLAIPMNPNARSLNVAISCALVVGEALRQLDAFPRSA